MKKLKLEELNRISIGEFKKEKKIPVTVILDNIRSSHNTGAVFRTSDAFLIEDIFLCGITAKPPHREITKTAIGATESVSWRYFKTTVEAIKKLKSENYHIIAVEQTDKSTDITKFNLKYNKKIAVVFGNEVKGVSNDALELCDESIEIPQYGTKHSLNISVCAGIVIWELLKKLS